MLTRDLADVIGVRCVVGSLSHRIVLVFRFSSLLDSTPNGTHRFMQSFLFGHSDGNIESLGNSNPRPTLSFTSKISC